MWPEINNNRQTEGHNLFVPLLRPRPLISFDRISFVLQKFIALGSV